MIKCGSHQSNLVVIIAVCGEKFNKPTEQCPITGTCVRFFKYLLLAYSEEFALSLWSYLDGDVKLVPLAEQTLESMYPNTIYGDQKTKKTHTHRMDRPTEGHIFSRVYLFWQQPIRTLKNVYAKTDIPIGRSAHSLGLGAFGLLAIWCNCMAKK